MDKSTLSQYGWVVICIIVLVLLIALATPFGNYVKDSVTATVESFSNKMKLTFENAGLDLPEKIYTIEEINADEHLYAIGKTKPEYVIAKFNADFSEVAILKNGEDSDGKMNDSVYGCFLTTEKFITGMKALYEAEYGVEVDVEYDETITDVLELDANICYYSHETGDELVLTENMFLNLNPADIAERSPKTIYIDDGIVNISDFAFIFCGNVKEIILPSTIETIGEYAFQYCKGLTKVVIPENIDVKAGTFLYCNNLTTVHLVNEAGTVVKALTTEEIDYLISSPY